MKLSNGKIEIEVLPFGAELRSLKKLSTNKEYLWQRNEAWWGKTSPNLFPYIGFNYNSRVKINGSIFETTKHGFIRDRKFVCNVEDDKLVCVYNSDNKDLITYPYQFELKIIYELDDFTLKISYIIKNLSKDTMFFEIGGHPAFNVGKGDKIKLSGRNLKTRYILEGPYVSKVMQENVSSFILQDDLFKNDALIYKGVDKISLISDDLEVCVGLKDFEYVGIWSMYKDNKMAPFVCVEPWSGLPDRVGFDKNISEKEGIQSIPKDGCKKYSFDIKIS